jgi:hypothetical protein
LARFKDGNEVKQLVTKVVNKVETILKKHWQSGHHSSGMERLKEIRKVLHFSTWKEYRYVSILCFSLALC